MAEDKALINISKRENLYWAEGCPVYIKEIRLTKYADVDNVNISVVSTPCTQRKIASFSVLAEYYNSRRELIGENAEHTFVPGSDTAQSPYNNAAYAEVTVTEVKYENGEIWKNATLTKGEMLPEQKIIWQFDPHYGAIKSVCRGKVDAKYYPDEITGGWRCACGGINLADSNSCGNCGAAKNWLDASFDTDYLEECKKNLADGKKTEPPKVIKKTVPEQKVSDKVKMILILSGAVLLVVLALLSVFLIVPSIKYNVAVTRAENGEYDSAIKLFESLGGFKDAEAQTNKTFYDKFVSLTGVEELYITDSVAEPWFTITDEGVLDFTSDKFTGDWANFVIPHVVNGIVVRELDKNCFLNCDQMVSVTFPDTLEVIGEQAFMNCTALIEINFGKGVSRILPRAFINCDGLVSVVVPDTVTELAQRVFNNCDNLASVTFGSEITEISAYIFSNCPALKSVVLQTPIESVGEYAFYGCESFEMVICYFEENEWTEPTVGDENLTFLNASIEFSK